ncbi:hypothetical protein Misp01_21580 [Microtetraspora sp. NBRC 13810]|uniref:hypothetical protein n=1 Tax=Microtetraspora sp. NBRC 13810 TaxID=3030990 RepID=UPI0024A4F441|nr:hypothetical protein [Microtetraspora sp. NBRC 13810]GLW07028.1 hypothetical protein Misp01_21580 [Microtetraspora sp. NBRC 13810]
MHGKRRLVILGTVLLGATLLVPAGAAAGDSARHAAAQSAAAQSRSCERDCKLGFRQGYRDGYKDCLIETRRDARTRRGFGEWARGYDLGYRRGFYACG